MEGAPGPPPPPPPPPLGSQLLQLDSEGCVNLHRILRSFNAPINEEHAWALAYQCAKCCRDALRAARGSTRGGNKQEAAAKSNKKVASGGRKVPMLVSEMHHVRIHRDGDVHSNTVYSQDQGSTRMVASSEGRMISCLGLVIFRALDYGLKEEEERHLSPDLEKLLDNMTSADESCERHETDDEGIERDSSDDEESSQRTYTFTKVLEHCSKHLALPSQADSHYKAVCRALVAEALELSHFLEKVSQGTQELRRRTGDTSPDLDNLQFDDWARLWVQVIRQLRLGVKLKKVDHPRSPPIEYELTPYEILMDDIRSRRYKLNKVMVDGDIPPRVKKDAHAIILEFIRSRPPLKKVSERQLGPPPRRKANPIELLLESIRQEHHLRPLKSRRACDPVEVSRAVVEMAQSSNGTSQPTRRLIKADFSLLDSLDDDDDDDFFLTSPIENGHGGQIDYAHFQQHNNNNNNQSNRRYDHQQGSKSTPASTPSSPWHRTALDLATQCRSGSTVILRRHTISVSTPSLQDRRRRPRTFANGGSFDHYAHPSMPRSSCSRQSLQEEFFRSNHWQQAVDCLSLTLEEVVHIRNVLTKAELESLPVDCSLKEDVEKSKVCFLCLKTRFSIFGPWGHKCKLCKRTVCAKCCSKMRIPTEHFSKVPVFTLSPNVSPREEEKESGFKTLMAKLAVPDHLPSGFGGGGGGGATLKNNTVGSAPPSPNLTRSQDGEGGGDGGGGEEGVGEGGVGVGGGSSHGGSHTGSHTGSQVGSASGDGDQEDQEDRSSSRTGQSDEDHESPQSLPSLSSVSIGILRMKTRYRASRAKALSKIEAEKAEKLKGSLMNVCHDCKTMVLQIIRSSRTKRSNVLKQMSLNLNPVY